MYTPNWTFHKSIYLLILFKRLYTYNNFPFTQYSHHSENYLSLKHKASSQAFIIQFIIILFQHIISFNASIFFLLKFQNTSLLLHSQLRQFLSTLVLSLLLLKGIRPTPSKLIHTSTSISLAFTLKHLNMHSYQNIEYTFITWVVGHPPIPFNALFHTSHLFPTTNPKVLHSNSINPPFPQFSFPS